MMKYNIEYINPHILYYATKHLRSNKQWHEERYNKIYDSIQRYGYIPCSDDIINITLDEHGNPDYVEGHKRLTAIHKLNQQNPIAVAVSEKPLRELWSNGRSFPFTDRTNGLKHLLEYPKFKAGYHPIKYLPHLTTTQAQTECDNTLKIISEQIYIKTPHPTILDAGPFFGYFGFELAEAGAEVIMVELERENVDVCNYVKRLYGFKGDYPLIYHVDICDFIDVNGCPSDYVLMLNMFHYVYQQNPEYALKTLNSMVDSTVFFSVNHEMLGLMTQDEVPMWVFNNTVFTGCENLGVGRVNKREGYRYIYKLTL